MYLYTNISTYFYFFQVRAQENVPVILVANKVDLEINGQRRVSTEEGEDMAKKIGKFGRKKYQNSITYTETRHAISRIFLFQDVHLLKPQLHIEVMSTMCFILQSEKYGDIRYILYYILMKFNFICNLYTILYIRAISRIFFCRKKETKIPIQCLDGKKFGTPSQKRVEGRELPKIEMKIFFQKKKTKNHTNIVLNEIFKTTAR